MKKINKLTLLLIVGLIIFAVSGFILINKFIITNKDSVQVEEQDLTFDPEGPYALLSPRKDGNALVLNLKRTSSYDKISYELAYTSKPEEVKSGSGDEVATGGVDRGVMGEINTYDKKGEYEQEILFGTCSKNVCKYDKGVENGTLTLHIKKGDKAYRMITQWHLQQPDVALGNLTSGDNHFTYLAQETRADLALIGYTIINDLTGIPKLPDGKSVLGKVYALNVPLIKQLPKGTVTVELSDNPGVGVKIARFDEGQNKWVEYDTRIDGSKLSASADNGGIFVVLTPKK